MCVWVNVRATASLRSHQIVNVSQEGTGKYVVHTVKKWNKGKGGVIQLQARCGPEGG